MWDWWNTKKSGQDGGQGHSEPTAPAAAAAFAGTARAADASAPSDVANSGAGDRAPHTTHSTALVPLSTATSSASASAAPAASALTPSANAASAPPGTASSPPSGSGFWGFTSSEVSSTSDAALDDMLSFYAFAHHRDSEYAGAVCFRLKYDDGTAVRVVEVLPKGEGEDEEAQQKRLLPSEGEKDSTTLVPSRPAARVLLRKPLLHNQILPPAATTEDAAQQQLVSLAADAQQPQQLQLQQLDQQSTSQLPWLLPSPCVTLIIRTRTAADTALVPVSSSVAAVPAEPLPRLSSSPRIRVYRDEVPAHVKLSCTLSCPRDVFFAVYMGKLDPIRAVLSGQAHCSGYKYMRLLHFGQAFDLRSERWVDFYKEQEKVAQAKAKWVEQHQQQPQLTGGAGGGQPLLTAGSSERSSRWADSPSSSSSAAAAAAASAGAMASMQQLGFVAPLPALVGLLGLAHERASEAVARFAHSLPPFTPAAAAAAASSAVAASAWPTASPAASRASLLPSYAMATQLLLPARRASAAASLPLLASAPPQPEPHQLHPVSATLRSMLQRARHVHASTRIVFACDEFD